MRIIAVGCLVLIVTPAYTVRGTPIAIVNPGFDFSTNGDGAQPPNTVTGNVNPVESYTTNAGEFYGSDPAFPLNGTAQFPGWSTSGNAGAFASRPSRFDSPIDGAMGYVGTGGGEMFQSLPGVLNPNTCHRAFQNRPLMCMDCRPG